MSASHSRPTSWFASTRSRIILATTSILLLLLLVLSRTVDSKHFGRAGDYYHRASTTLQQPLTAYCEEHDHDKDESLPARTSCAAINFRNVLPSDYNYTDSIRFARRYIRTEFAASERIQTTTLHQSLFPAGLQSFSSRDTDAALAPDSACDVPLVLPVRRSPLSGNTDLSSFIFGVSTEYKRLIDSIPTFKRWLTHEGKSNGGRLVVLLDYESSDAATMGAAARALKDAAIPYTLHSAPKDDDMPLRYFSLVPRLYEEYNSSSNATKPDWLVIIDDDTFFPRPSALRTILANYVSQEPRWLGSFDEFIALRGRLRKLTIGGAGVFINPAFAEHIIPFMPYCRKEDRKVTAGDAKLANCAYRHSDALEPWNLPGLHQLDMQGDTSGFYESGKPTLSVHHWKSWHFNNPLMRNLVGDVCGEDCILQRFRFLGAPSAAAVPSSEQYVITNGYSIARYPSAVADAIDWRRTERTWDKYGGKYGKEWRDMDYGVGLLREPVPEKVSYLLLASNTLADGTVRQLYGRYPKREILVDGGWGAPEDNRMALRPGELIDEVMELFWLPALQKAP